jgi:hypothetical protein
MSTPVFPGFTETPGNQKRIAYGVEQGDLNVASLTARNVSYFNSTVHVDGDLILGTTSVVDVNANTIYTFADPLIHLNTTFTGLYIPESGLRIFRGGLSPEARLEFIEDPTRTNVDWRIGLGTDVLRICRLNDSISLAADFDHRVPFWDITTSSITTTTGVKIYTDRLSTIIPVWTALRLGSGSNLINLIGCDTSCDARVVYYTNDATYGLGTPEDYLKTLFEVISYGGYTPATHVPGLSSMYAMRFNIETNVATLPDPRFCFIYDQLASLGYRSDDTGTILRTDNPAFTLQGDAVPGVYNDYITADSTGVHINGDLDLGVHYFNAARITSLDSFTGTQSFDQVDSYTPLPVIPTWTPTTGSYVYDSVNINLATSLSGGIHVYEVRLTYSILIGPMGPARLLAPIQLAGSMGNLRGLYGVTRELDAPGGNILRCYGIPPGDIWITPPFDVDANLTAVRCLGYSFVMVNYKKALGHWDTLVTIVSSMPITS